MSVLSVRDLRVSYRTSSGDVPAVRGVDLEIPKGQVLGLAGESGCGKSTIAAAILRLLPRRTLIEGQVLLNGEDVLAMSPRKLRAVRWAGASIIFQGAMHALNPVKRVGDQIAEAVETHGLSRDREARVRAGDLLEEVGLPPRRSNDYPHELSGGQRQRVMIAMALACGPDLVIADEPTTALDVMVQAQVLALLKRLQREFGLAMLFITHDLSVLVEVSDRLAVMYAGKIGDQRFRRHPSGLGGDPPDPQRIPSGCPFHPRCPDAFEACPSTVPWLFEAGPDRRAACLLVEGALAEATEGAK
jgi:peptide/nickel transport system ATP-binding protein